MRRIGPHEETLTASEVAERISAATGTEVTSHKVGRVAKMLDLDYVVADLKIQTFTAQQKRYGIEDLEAIATALTAATKTAAQHEHQSEAI